MMSKKSYSIILVITIIFCFCSSRIYAYSSSKALIIYENEKTFGYNENTVNHLNELLYVFNKSVKKININEYKQNDIKNYDSVFVINIRNDISNEYLLNDLANYEKKIYWIGDKIENLLEVSNKYKLSYNGTNNNINEVSYKDKSLSIESGYLFNIINTSELTRTLATMSDGYNIYPFIVNEYNLYYISRWDLTQNFIFDDTLNEFYKVNNIKKGQVFVRIEDVHPFRDTKKLREITDYLYSKNIPFMIALIPTFIDTKTKVINTLDLKPDFVETIKYMQNKGGTVLLHGYTHQIGKEEISGEGYEFWDMETDTPIRENIETYVKDRSLSGLRLCIENGIYPLGFEAPHYAMNIDGYKEIKKYFSTYVGQYQNNNDNFSTSTFPYIIKNSDTFNKFIPENLGYIEEEELFSVDLIKENFDKLSMVRGYTGGFFYHPYLDISYLKECVEYLENQNVEFMDLKYQDNYVKVDDIKITSKEGKIECSYDKSKAITSNKVKTKFDTFIQNINNVVVIFISIILALFLIIFIVFRRINKNKFMRR